MTHAELVRLAERWLRSIGCGVVLTELRCYSVTGEEPDALGWQTSTSILVEAKCSRADFRRDLDKPFRRSPDQGVGRWRFYLCPDGLIRPDELPANWGLLYVRGGKVEPIVGLPLGNAHWPYGPFTANLNVERQFLYSCLRRVQRTKAGRDLSVS